MKSRAIEDLDHETFWICTCVYITENNGDENRKDLIHENEGNDSIYH